MTLLGSLRGGQTPSVGTSAGEGHFTYVPALDGLRAFAVLAVIAYHLQVPVLGGGFLGVDLFFVLSGFLITTLLLRTRGSRSLKSNLRDFYLRRTRRLLPALTLLLIAVSAWAALIALPEQISHLRAEGLGTVFYVSNWVFMAQESTYFEAFNDPSPLQHTWSLAIEEQFYLVWPVIVLVLIGRRIPRAWLLAGSALIAGASAILMWTTASSGALNDAYLGTFTRIHELMIGALAAMVLSSPRRGRHRYTPRYMISTTIIASALVLAISMVVLSPEGMAYYQGGSVLFSIVVAALILVLVRHRPEGGMILGNPVIRWIGAISYGLYLWHWPAIVWLTPATTPLNGLALDALRLGAMFAAATASYYLVEQPIRRGGWGRLRISARAWWVAVPTSMALSAGLVVAGTTHASVSATQVLTPDAVSVDSRPLGSAQEGARNLLIVGDSVLQTMMPAIDEAAKAQNASIIPLAFGGCSVVGLFQVDDAGEEFNWSERCTQTTQLQDEALAKHSPDTVVWLSHRERFGVRGDDGEVIWTDTPEHRSLMEAEILAAARRLTSTGAHLIIVQPVAKAQATTGACSTEPESGDCSASATQIASFEWLRSAYDRVAQEVPRTTVVSVDDLLCPTGTPCPAEEVDGVPIRPDGVHIAEELKPWFAAALLNRVLAVDIQRPSR